MTTIAYRNLVMCCDSCWTDCADAQQTSANKITRLKGGGLLGSAGDNDSRDVDALFANVKTEAQLPSRKDILALALDYAGIFVLPNGKAYIVEVGHGKPGWYGGLFPANRGFAAVGSGGHLALGAMRAGKSAHEAVTIACEFDRNSKLPVHRVALELKRRRK